MSVWLMGYITCQVNVLYFTVCVYVRGGVRVGVLLGPSSCSVDRSLACPGHSRLTKVGFNLIMAERRPL